MLSSMPVHGKISIGRLREAYHLTINEADDVVQALWPHAVFPIALWLKSHEICWKDFAIAHCTRYRTKLPLLPQPPSNDKKINTFLFSLDIVTFFRRLSFIIPVHPLMIGFNSILEESYDDATNLFQDDRRVLFSSLQKLEDIGESNIFSPDSPYFEDSSIGIAASYYHFISKLYPDTILVERNAAIKYLYDYPLRNEVKGITRNIVESILARTDIANSTPLACSADSVDAPAVEQADGSKLTYRIPSTLWMGLPEKTVRDALAEKYPLPVIAYVLFNWCVQEKIGAKTRIGRLLADADVEYSDPKSYRNLVDKLLNEASAYNILQS